MNKEHPHRPLNVLFLLTSMPVGGAETLLVNLIRRMDRKQFVPQIACLKELDELGEVMAEEVSVASDFLANKYDMRVLPRLVRFLSREKVDALVTVGAGDKMFWGRIAAWFTRTPVVISALHSTGWPDGVGRLNRMLTPLTDAFVGVAEEHGRFLCEVEQFPNEKVRVIPNGVDTERFRRDVAAGAAIREEFGIPMDAPVCGIVAALRPEKNHELFVTAAHQIRQQLQDAHFLVVGDGPERDKLERMSQALRLENCLHFLGTRDDIPAVLAAMNCLLLTSKMEANPVSILEGLATQVPVVATNVGSVAATVIDDQTGFLVPSDNAEELTKKACRVLVDLDLAERLGHQGRDLVAKNYSVDVMVDGYEDLIREIYQRKSGRRSDSQRTSIARNPDETPQCTPAFRSEMQPEEVS